MVSTSLWSGGDDENAERFKESFVMLLQTSYDVLLLGLRYGVVPR